MSAKRPQRLISEIQRVCLCDLGGLVVKYLLFVAL
jgi:hypothetical protein